VNVALRRSWRFASGRVDGIATRPEVTLHWLLRIGCAMCFIGHGAWGVLTKAGWLPFYGVFGIPPAVAWRTMPLVGSVDIALGLTVLVFPFRALFAYMIVWTLFTALLRPLAGMGTWEFLERGGNYGPPIAFFVVASESSRKWFERVVPRPLSSATLGRASLVLRASLALLLVGHGAFALILEKAILIGHFRAIGIPADRAFLHAVGAAEILAAVAVYFRPSRTLLVGVAYWKIASELLYPISGRLRDGWEWVERGGDYVAPFALLCVLVLLDDRRAPGSARSS